MSLFHRIARTLPESYILNIPQMFHMVILAGFIPWYIGVENYGRFAAVIAIPGLFQSFFEAFCVAILIRYQSRSILHRPIVTIVLPLIVAVSIVLFFVLPPVNAVLATAMTVFLFCRSFSFAVAITSGIQTRAIVINEGLILLCYILIALLGVHFEIRDITLPLGMITVSSAVTFLHLQHAIRTNGIIASETIKDHVQPIPSKVIAGALMVRAFEDGLLTISPLILTLTVSNASAGQFRILVSAIKVAYKLFPYRYEVLMRDVESRQQSFRRLAIACVFYSVVSALISFFALLFMPTADYQWLLPLLAVSGAVVSCLSVYPVSCMKDSRMSLALIIGLLATYVSTIFLGSLGFVIGFCFTSYLVMIGSLYVISKKLGKVCTTPAATRVEG